MDDISIWMEYTRYIPGIYRKSEFQMLGATTGALNPIDVLVIGAQDGLQLRLEGVRLHFGVYIHHTDLWFGTNILKVEHQSEYNKLKHWTA